MLGAFSLWLNARKYIPRGQCIVRSNTPPLSITAGMNLLGGNTL
jgi:hypothetical protein